MSHSCLMMNIVGDQCDLKSVIQRLQVFFSPFGQCRKGTSNSCVSVKLYFDIIVIKNMALLSFWNEKKGNLFQCAAAHFLTIIEKTLKMIYSSVFHNFQALCLKIVTNKKEIVAACCNPLLQYGKGSLCFQQN